MKKLLIKVDYTDNSKKFWHESYLKNKIITLEDNQNIHDTIAETIKETDGIVLSYKNRPQSNIYIDDKDEQAHSVGYVYRGSEEIYNNEKGKYEKALFDIWVSIKEVIDYPIEDIN